MNAGTHHIPDHILAAYAAGTLSHPFAVAVASHVSMCDQCRASLGAHQAVGGAVLEGSAAVAVSGGMKADLLAQLGMPWQLQPRYDRKGIYPAPIVEALRGEDPKWKRLGGGVRQSILHAGPQGTVRLLYIPGGQAVPDHGHNGLEMTLVLQGSFSDETGRFGVGDIEIADEDLDHTPIADPGEACICLAATDAPLRFHRLVPRVLQPFFQI